MKMGLQPLTGGDQAPRRLARWISVFCAVVLGAGLQVQAQQPPGTYNVKTDGAAQGNGISDDTTAIQSALTAAKTQGKDVYFPAGTYMVTGQIDVPNTTSIFGDKSGVSLIKAVNPVVNFGEPDNDATTVGNLSIEDMFFLNVSVYFTGTQKNNITVRRCVLATDKVYSASWFLCILSRGDDNTIEDSIFLGGHNTGNWPGLGVMLKGINTYRNDRMQIQRNIFGMDLGNLTWLDTEWEGYANWNNVEARLQQFKTAQGLPRRMGEMSGGIRLNECRQTVVDQCIFHFDPIATEVPQEANNLDVDHLIYATQATDLEITRNWFSGHPPNPGGGLKHRDTAGPGVIAANYLKDTPIILYTYDNDLANDFENQLIYRNFLKITDFDTLPGMGMRLGIWFWSTDWQAPYNHTGRNIDVANNVYDVDPQSMEASVPIEITYGDTSATGWRIYTNNTYLDSGNTIPISGNGYAAPYSYTAGSPSAVTWDLAKYDSMSIPFLNIPPFGTDPTNTPPVFTSNPVVETNAMENSAYSGSIADNATDGDSDPLTFAKISGPAWLAVSTNGVLSGTPAGSAVGTNIWAVQVTDGAATNTATLQITVQAAPTGPVTLSFNPADDTTAKQAHPTDNYGAATVINTRVDSNNTEMNGYLKFSVQGLNGSVTGIKLKLYSLHNHTVSVHSVADTSWTEGALVWNNRPAIGALLASLAVTADSMVEINLPASAVTTNGNVSFALKTDSLSFRNFNTKEAGSNIPVLEVTYQGGATNHAPIFTSNPVVEVNATKNAAYNSSIADNATDDDSDPLTFAKAAGGPVWLNVATNGVLMGTPGAGDVGPNAWTVQVTDGMATNTTVLQITVDSDGDWDDDGIPDAWELQYFGHETNAVASQDTDGDEFDNLAEYISGFNPTNVMSYPAITGFAMAGGGTNRIISWLAVEGRAYDVLRANSLTGTFSMIQSNIFYPQNSHTVTVDQAESTGFYRVNFRLQGTAP